MKGKHDEVTAIIPMRHNSQRVPGKNYRSLAGKPLYHYVIETVLQVPGVSRVVIDTDSPIIKEDASRYFPNVTVLDRPSHLQAPDTPMNDVLLNVIQTVESEFYLQTHATNPLLMADTITRAIEQFVSSHPVHDSLFGVTRMQTRLWDALARPINHNQAILMQTQDLPAVYEENSCLYIFSKEVLEREHNRIGRRPLMFEIDRQEAIDIDDELDFVIAENLYYEREKQVEGARVSAVHAVSH